MLKGSYTQKILSNVPTIQKPSDAQAENWKLGLSFMRTVEIGFSHKMKEFCSSHCPVEGLFPFLVQVGKSELASNAFSASSKWDSVYNSKLEETHSCARGQDSVHSWPLMPPVVSYLEDFQKLATSSSLLWTLSSLDSMGASHRAKASGSFFTWQIALFC